MIVVDASTVVELLLRPDRPAVARRLLDDDGDLHAPELLDLEVIQVLRRHVRSGEMAPRRAAEAFEDLSDLPLRRHPLTPLRDRIWRLRDVATAYDAAYLALAEALRVPLVTLDRKLGSSRGHGARVEVL